MIVAALVEAASALLDWSAVVSVAVDHTVEGVVCAISEVVVNGAALVLLAISLLLLVGSALGVDIDE